MSDTHVRILGEAAEKLQEFTPAERLAVVAAIRAVLKVAQDGRLSDKVLDPTKELSALGLARAFDFAASSEIGANAWAYALDEQLQHLIDRMPHGTPEAIRRLILEDGASGLERLLKSLPVGATAASLAGTVVGALLPRGLALLLPGAIAGPIGLAVGGAATLLMIASLRSATSQDRALVQSDTPGLAELVAALAKKDATLGVGDLSLASVVLHVAQHRPITVDIEDRLAARTCAWLNDAGKLQAVVRDPDEARNASGFGFVFLDSTRSDPKAGLEELQRSAPRPSRCAILTTGRFLARTVGEDRDMKAGLVEDGSLRAVVKLASGQEERDAGAQHAREGGAYLLYIDTQARDPASPVLMAAAPSEAQRGFLGGLIDTITFSSQSRPDLQALATAITAQPRDLGKASLDLPFASVSREELQKGRYNVLPERHLPGMAASTVDGVLGRLAEAGRRVDLTLNDVADVLKPQALQDISDHEDDPSPLTILEAVPDDIDERFAILRTPTKRISIRQRGGKAKDRAKAQMLQQGDVVVTIRGRCGRVAVVPGDKPEDTVAVDGWTAGQSFARLRLRAGSAVTDPVALAAYLRSPLGQAQLAAITTRGSADQISLPDLRGIRIVAPTSAELAELRRGQVRADNLRTEIQALEAEAARLADGAWPSSLLQPAERAALTNTDQETDE